MGGCAGAARFLRAAGTGGTEGTFLTGVRRVLRSASGGVATSTGAETRRARLAGGVTLFSGSEGVSLRRRGFAAEGLGRASADFFFRGEGEGLAGAVTSAGVNSSETVSTRVTTAATSPSSCAALRAFFSAFLAFLPDFFSAFLVFLPFFSFSISGPPWDFSFFAAFFLTLFEFQKDFGLGGLQSG